MKKLSIECRNLEKEFNKKASNIPNIIESISKNDSNFESEYLGKKFTVEDIHNLQNTRKDLLEELEILRKDEDILEKEIQELELKWNIYRKKTERLENEISLKKTETSHEAIQIDAHINSRLSINNDIDNTDDRIINRVNRRNSVAKWIGRLSIQDNEDNNSNDEINKINDNNDNSLSSNNIDEKEEEVQGELQVLNLLSIVKIDDLKKNEINNYKDDIINLKIDPSPLLSNFLDPDFIYLPGIEPISTTNHSKENHNNNNLFKNGTLNFNLKIKNQCDGTKTFEEITLINDSKNISNSSINNEDIALFNIFVGELKRNENIPISSIGKLLCSTLK